jgi:hypothetical protein
LGRTKGAVNPPVPAQTQNETTTPTVKSRAANSRVWEVTPHEQSPAGEITRPHYFTELATGMHYKNAQGDWTESKEYIEAYATGAIARQGQYQVIFANNLNSAGSIDMQTPDGKRLRSNILGLGYYDSSTGQSVLIAQIQDSQGELTADNVVLYPNAFEGVKADVRYTYKKGSFEQDIILREQPPTPESLGLNSSTTVIQVMTEFLNPPQETIKEPVIKNGTQSDQSISWGAMRIGHGKAFDLGDDQSQRSKVQVIKEYVTSEGRKILLEKVPLPNINASISKLPKQASIKSKLPMTAFKTLQLPKAPLAQTEQRPMKIAAAAPSKHGYVLDFVVLNTDTNNFTFQCDTTYFVTAEVNLTGTTTFEGGTVIKCDPSAWIDVDAYGTIVCKTSPYRPAVFTSINDDNVGDPGWWSGDPYYTGSPAQGDIGIFLSLSCGNPILKNMRFCYATKAILVNSGYGTIDLWDCQFMQAYYCVWATDVSVGLHNILINEVMSDYPIAMFSSGNFLGENVTSDGYYDADNRFVYVDYPGSQVVSVTNALITMGSYVSMNGGTPAYSSDPIYQIVGGGNYYLPTNSPYRNVGTSNNLAVGLWAELRQKTTYPPIVYDTVTFDTDTVLSPQAQRDTDTPDLGYHYDPLDYVIISGELVSNLTLTAGTAAGFYNASGYGLYFDDGSSLTVAGTATAPCWLAGYNTAQEGGNGNWPIPLLTILLELNGDGNINANFSKWPAMTTSYAHILSFGSTDTASVANSEFYGMDVGGYGGTFNYTNCLFHRVYNFYWDQGSSTAFTYQNCTFFGGFLALTRYNTAQWTIKNTAFDGTGFLTVDDYVYDTNYTHFDFNAYNTNNLGWVDYPSGYWSDQALQTNGVHTITNTFTWQSSWFGEFYEPSNSVLVNTGNPTADLVGLYHFTTQTNQVKETNSVVDIGYHYVATDEYGNPIDTDGDGSPDYIEDTNGNGSYDGGDSGDWLLSPYNGLTHTDGLRVFTPLK